VKIKLYESNIYALEKFNEIIDACFPKFMQQLFYHVASGKGGGSKFMPRGR